MDRFQKPLQIETHIVDVERFTGLNIHGFNPIKVFVETLLVSVLKERYLCSLKGYVVLLQTMKTVKV